MEVFILNVKICLDAGHYASYNKSPVNENYREARRMWTLAKLLEKALKEMGMEVTMTRKDPEKDLALVKRGEKSRDHDLFLSLHSNAAQREDADHIVIFCPTERENSEVHEISLRLAKKMAPLLTNVMGVKEKEYRIASVLSADDRDQNGKKDDDYYGVLHGAATVGTPALIVEHSFHTNKRAADWLMDDANLEKLALCEAECIADFFKVEKPVYRVQVGAYTKRQNAEKMAKKLKENGFPCFITADKDYYRVQTGAFCVKKYAENLAATLRSKNFPAIIKR